MRPYLTDEELARFIEDIEKEPLYAPGHISEEIMKSLKKQDIISVQKLRQNKIQMLTYSMKIAVGMAAALFLIIVLPRMPMEYLMKEPMDRKRQEAWRENENRFEDALQKGTDAINDTSEKIFNSLMSINHLFDKEE